MYITVNNGSVAGTLHFLYALIENRMLRRIFGPKREEVVGDWRRLHSEGIHNLYTSPDIISVIKSRKMGWVGHVA
jgi:hypothetical protein